ncbi:MULTISPECIES: recombinase family protein [Klebsiella]|uniref:recombinase family protein n=1 Tax=Klebsiella TaxID=570 RepID=UPI0015FC47E7|nr:recombinase family protein [Klebsiella michiganensis]
MSFNHTRPTSEALTAYRRFSTESYKEKVKPVVEELLTFGYGYTALASVLNGKGIFTKQGRPFTKGNVRYLLQILELETHNNK